MGEYTTSVQRAIFLVVLTLVISLSLYWLALLTEEQPNPLSNAITPWSPKETQHPHRSASPTTTKKTTPPLDPTPLCPTVREAYEKYWTEAMNECEPSVLASGCLGPVPFPPDEPSPDEWAKVLSSTLDACNVPREYASLDCIEFPCIVVATESHVDEVASCIGSPPSEKKDGLAILGALRSHKVGRTVQEHIDRRDAYRWKIVKHQQSTDIARVPWPGCAKAKQLLDSSVDCQQVEDLLGCEPAPPDQQLTTEEVEEYVQDVQDYLTELEARCDNFRNSEWFLDCEKIPCMLGTSYDERKNQEMSTGDFVCGSSTILNQVTVYNRGVAPDRVTLYPLLNHGSEDMQDVIRARWEAQSMYRTESLTNILGRGSSKH